MLDFSAYERNDGTICIYAHEGEEPVWAVAHRDPEEAAKDMAALANGADPREDGWEGDELDEGEENAREMIANSSWHLGSDESLFDVGSLCCAGRRMFAAFCGHGVEEG